MILLKPCIRSAVFALCCILALAACERERKIPAPPHTENSKRDSAKPAKAETPAISFRYHFISQRNKDKAIRDSAKAFMKGLSPAERDIVLRLNRVDAASLHRLDTLIVPEPLDTNWMDYSVFPAELPVLSEVRKMVLLAYYPEAFAAYENGRLVRWGPTSMGKKSTPTPTGLFSCNWKARESISTVSDEWKLKWNFNIWNKGGVGWHEYQMPGHPASHSCIRLQEPDAKFLYDWAEQWVLKNKELAAQGTPVLIFGAYPFGQGKPWWRLVENPQALQLSADTLTSVIKPHLPKIMVRQGQRDSLIQRG
jgi:hypothetical protein